METFPTLTMNKANDTATAPMAKTVTYYGSAQELVNAGSTNDGTLYCSVTTENKAPMDEKLYTTSIPSKIDAGTYYVWYKVKGDENHNDTTPECIPVTISGSKIDNETIDSLPQTGDTAKPLLYGFLALIALVGLGLLIKKKSIDRASPLNCRGGALFLFGQNCV